MKSIVLAVLATALVALAHPLAHANEHESAATKPVVLITGSNRGIGLEFVRQLSARDWRIIATARAPENATELRALAEADPDIAIETLDVTDDDEIAALKAKYPETPIDILLLNAAMGPQGLVAFKNLDFDLARQMFDVNTFGPMKISQTFYENVKASQLKQIIAISSDSGSFVESAQAPILFHYKASKAALNMYFHTLAFETKRRGVTAIMLHPGIVASNPNTARLPGAMPTEDSVSQMLTVIDGLTVEDNGRFMDYRGETMPW